MFKTAAVFVGLGFLVSGAHAHVVQYSRYLVGPDDLFKAEPAQHLLYVTDRHGRSLRLESLTQPGAFGEVGASMMATLTATPHLAVFPTFLSPDRFDREVPHPSGRCVLRRIIKQERDQDPKRLPHYLKADYLWLLAFNYLLGIYVPKRHVNTGLIESATLTRRRILLRGFRGLFDDYFTAPAETAKFFESLDAVDLSGISESERSSFAFELSELVTLAENITWEQFQAFKPYFRAARRDLETTYREFERRQKRIRGILFEILKKAGFPPEATSRFLERRFRELPLYHSAHLRTPLTHDFPFEPWNKTLWETYFGTEEFPRDLVAVQKRARRHVLTDRVASHFDAGTESFSHPDATRAKNHMIAGDSHASMSTTIFLAASLEKTHLGRQIAHMSKNAHGSLVITDPLPRELTSARNILIGHAEDIQPRFRAGNNRVLKINVDKDEVLLSMAGFLGMDLSQRHFLEGIFLYPNKRQLKNQPRDSSVSNVLVKYPSEIMIPTNLLGLSRFGPVIHMRAPETTPTSFSFVKLPFMMLYQLFLDELERGYSNPVVAILEIRDRILVTGSPDLKRFLAEHFPRDEETYFFDIYRFETQPERAAFIQKLVEELPEQKCERKVAG